MLIVVLATPAVCHESRSQSLKQHYLVRQIVLTNYERNENAIQVDQQCVKPHREEIRLLLQARHLVEKGYIKIENKVSECP